MEHNRSKCFVPNCYNEVGVLFPKNLEIKKKWLKSLELEHLKPTATSFVCLDHFEEDGQTSILPKIIKNKSYEKDVKKQFVKAKVNQIDSSIDKEYQQKKHIVDTQYEKDKAQIVQVLKSETAKQTKNEKAPSFEHHKDYRDYSNMCRLCMSQAGNEMVEMENIYNKIDGISSIADAIVTCLYPLKVSSTDKLSKSICPKCLEILKEFYEFHQFCMGMDEKQRELVSIGNEYNSDDHDADSENSEEYFHMECLEDYDENKENSETSKSKRISGELLKKYLKNQDKNVDESMENRSEIDKKFDKVEEELLKVLEGDNSQKSLGSNNQELTEYGNHSIDNPSENLGKANDDTIYTENIVIEMVDDDETESGPEPTTLVKKLPITIKPVKTDTPRRRSIKRRRNDSSSSNNNLTMIKAGGDSNEIVVLPSGIKVQIKEKYYSPLGVFSCKIIRYLFNLEFVLAVDYLYEYRLTKDSIRHLHCIALKCPARAIQKKADEFGQFTNEIEVIKSHNHHAPDSLERKKQMFYNIMFKKMQKDKNFNFKILYEQMCNLDRKVKEILPLRKIINEICKHGPASEVPTTNSFDDFYNSIENDAFNRIHFTENQVQFYQDKFEASNGAKAVIFGNSEVIKQYSSSKLMFVDASFNIDTDDFFYQLVTVLVWVHDSYYPILYAFVNQKSQEIYKQIFSFLYYTLAPKLRPEEIITDYEANLYYALGETYIESSIGGSVFYFTQNLYKTICGMQLSRELELNSNFRSIYNMLLMLPLLPVNTIVDGLNNIEVQAKELGLESLTQDLFQHVHNEWISKVTPELFCVHRLENRINENIVAPFKKLRDLIMLSKSKSSKSQLATASVVHVIEKLIELEKFLRDTYNSPSKKSFARDLSSSQKKIVLKAWNFIEDHPKININHFFMKVLGYIKCMENQLWIWGFYRYEGNTNDDLINAANFSIVSEGNHESEFQEQEENSQLDEPMTTDRLESQEDESEGGIVEEYYIEESGNIKKVEKRTNSTLSEEYSSNIQDHSRVQEKSDQTDEKQVAVVMEALIDENGSFVLQNTTNAKSSLTDNLFIDNIEK